MTLQTQTNKATYNGLIGQDTFAYNFRVDEKEDMFVYLAGLVIDAGDFTMTGLGEDVGGNVILNTPLAVDQSVTLIRTVPFTQLVDYQPFDSFPAETHEGALDNLTMLTQQLQEEVDRAYKSPIDSEPGQDFQMPPWDAGKFIAWDETTPDLLVNSPYSQQDIIAEADRATAAADSADIFAGNAFDSAELSEDFADNDEDVPVQDTTMFSAKHWAIKAAKSVGGLTLRAIIPGDDTCPKPGDDPPSVCTVPDTRNPGQRFEQAVFLQGDYFLISNEGTMELKDPADPIGPMTIQNVLVGDYIILLPEMTDGVDVVIGAGWYRQEALSGGPVSANLVSFDDGNTITKGTDLQTWNSALDGQVLRLIGGVMQGQINGVVPTDPPHLTRKDYVDDGDATNAGQAAAAQASADAAQGTANAATFPTGTRMLFQQTDAPVGWTKGVDINDKALRIVSGAAASGGSVPFSTVFARISTDGHTLAEGEMPSHTHTFQRGFFTGNSYWSGDGMLNSVATEPTGAVGGGGSHTHNMDIRVQYVDVIYASKD